MTRKYFYGNEEKIMNRLLALQSIVGEQSLHTTPCPLLAAQLNELAVLCGRLQADVQQMAAYVLAAGHEA